MKAKANIYPELALSLFGIWLFTSGFESYLILSIILGFLFLALLFFRLPQHYLSAFISRVNLEYLRVSLLFIALGLSMIAEANLLTRVGLAFIFYAYYLIGRGLGKTIDSFYKRSQFTSPICA